MNDPDGGRSDEELFRQAADWFARMRGPDAERCKPEFEAWLAGSARRRAAHNRVSEVFAMGKLLRDEQPADPSNAPAADRKTLISALLALLVVGGAAAWLALAAPNGPPPSLSSPRAVELATRAGERRLLRLSDGSKLTLEGATLLQARFDGSARRLLLLRGQAMFEVARDGRSFTVFAGGGSVTARGTLFKVDLTRHRKVVVRLYEGLVDVELPASARNGKPPVRLQPGDSLDFSAQSQAAQLPPVAVVGAEALSNPASRSSDFNNIRVSELVARINRRGTRQIRLAETPLGERRISGRFSVDDPEVLAERLAILLDLAVDRSDPHVLTLRRKH